MIRALIPLLLVILFSSCFSASKRIRAQALEPDVKAQQRTAKLYVMCEGREGWATGSGVVLEPRVLITAFHVVECKGYGLVLVKHNGQTIRARVGLASKELDLAVLSLDTPTVAPPVVYGPVPKKDARICAYPARKVRDPVCGSVLRVRRMTKEDLAMQLHVKGGDSGGGVYDKKGRLIAIVISRLKGRDGIVGFATLLEGKLSVEE